MATRKEEKARLRAARLEAEQREAAGARKRLILGYGVAGVLTAAVLAGIVVVIASGGGGSAATRRRPPTSTPRRAASTGSRPTLARARLRRRSHNLDLTNAAARCGLRPAAEPARRGQPARGARTPTLPTTTPTRRPRATTSPPRSSRPTAPTARSPSSIDFVHSLEHGRIEIQYAPDLPEAGPARPEGRLRREPVGHAAVPEPPDAVRGRGHRLDAAHGMQDATRGRRRWTRSATSATSTAAAAPRRRSRSLPEPGGGPRHSPRRFLLLPARPALAQRGRDRRPEHDQHRQRVQGPEVPVAEVCERQDQGIRRWTARAGTGPGR